MSTQRRLVAGVAAVGMVVVLLAGSLAMGASAAETPTPTPSATPSVAPIRTATTFTMGVTQDVDSTNPFTGITVAAYEIYQLAYDTLTSYTQKDFAAGPGLARTWETSADGKTWTYHLQQGVKWSDGQPLTADDVVYSYNRVINGTYEQTNWGNYVVNITKVTAPDDHTVVMTLKQPTPIMLHIPIPILPKHIWSPITEKAVGSYANEPSPGKPIVGSGPFVLTQVVKGQFIRLERNPSYRGQPSHIDHLVIRVFKNQESMAQALRRGEIDYADSLDPGVFNALKADNNITTVPAKYSGFDEIAFNTGAALDDGTPIGDGHPALKDPKLRVALSYAIDNKTLVDKVLGGYGEPATSVIPSLYKNLHYDPGAATRTFDLAKANQLLDAAGYTKGSDGIRRMPGGGRPLSFRLFGRTDSVFSQRSVEYVAGWLKQVGIDIKLKMVSEDSLTEIIGQGNFDMFEWGWVVEPDPDYQLSTFTCASRSYKDSGSIYANLSDSFYCDKAYDDLYAKQATQINPVERAATVKTMQKMLYDSANYAMTFYYDDLTAYRSDRWTNFKNQPEPDGALLFQYGVYSYLSILPLTSESKGEGPTPGQAGLVVGGAVALWGLAFAVTRWRRPSDDEVE